MGKVIQINTIRRKKHQNFCHCYIGHFPKKPNLTIDEETHTVLCDWCGNRIEPFDALMALTIYGETYMEELERIRKELVRIYKLIHNYKPWKRALKDIESSVGRKGEMVPCCPKCHEPFELSEITNYVNRKYVRED